MTKAVFFPNFLSGSFVRALVCKLLFWIDYEAYSQEACSRGHLATPFFSLSFCCGLFSFVDWDPSWRCLSISPEPEDFCTNMSCPRSPALTIALQRRLPLSSPFQLDTLEPLPTSEVSLDISTSQRASPLRPPPFLDLMPSFGTFPQAWCFREKKRFSLAQSYITTTTSDDCRKTPPVPLLYLPTTPFLGEYDVSVGRRLLCRRIVVVLLRHVLTELLSSCTQF